MSGETTRHARRSGSFLVVVAALGLLLCGGFTALGLWQVRRLSWKQALIADVQYKLAAAPVAAPARATWPALDTGRAEYTRVQIVGRYLDDRDTLVHALTERGAGYWILSPLRPANGGIVLINRGFVPLEHHEAARSARTAGKDIVVTGLLRPSEPHAGFLRRNVAASDSWYSRDVAGIAAARGLTNVAPFFIDADAAPSDPDAPVGGLTVVTFSNNHLLYAITWFTLAAGVLGAALVVVRPSSANGVAKGPT